MKNILYLFIIALLFSSCKDDDAEITTTPEETKSSYFPPKIGTWETTSPQSLNWNADSITSLYDNLETNGTRAFIVLKDGKIVLENYWGKDLLAVNDFDKSKNWYWASAAKTLTAFTVGKAQEQGKLELTDKSSKYLGENWTSLTKEQEDKITVWHQLTMTTGLDDGTGNADGWEPEDLIYKADAGTRWAYHNAPYTLLDHVIEEAVNQDFEPYFNGILRDKIGMDGFWTWSGDNHLYFSTARSAARYGNLMLNNGVWDGERLLNKEYVDAMTTKSQDINLAYGYLWWLNGSSSFRLPQSQIEFPGMILTDAPSDVYSAMGKNGQYISVSPSEGLVVIRMGDSPDQSLVPLLYLNDIWKMLGSIKN